MKKQFGKRKMGLKEKIKKLVAVNFDATDLWMGSDTKVDAPARISSVDGFSVEADEVFEEPKSYAIKAGDTVVGGLWGNGDAVFLESRSGKRVSIFGVEGVRMLGGTGGFFVDVSTDAITLRGDLVIPNIPTSDPGVGNKVFTQTASQLGGTGTTKVLCISDGPANPPATPNQPTICKTGTLLIIDWNAVSTAESYDVERKIGGGTFQLWRSGLSGSSTADSVPSGDPSTTYSYRVRACNATGCSSYSTAASTTFNGASAC